MDIEKFVRKELANTVYNLEELLKDVSRRKRKNCDGSLACNYSNGVPQYFIDGKYVAKKNIQLVKNLAQLDYEEKVINWLANKRRALEQLLPFYENSSIEHIYDNLCRGRKAVVLPTIEPRESFVKNWINVQYEPSARWDEIKGEFYTLKDERVRSKAEKIIADELTKYKIPYRYEYPYELSVGNQKKVFRPDFTVLNCRTRKEYVIEHLGMMDKTGYYNQSLSKLDVLEHNGFLLGVNLLLFHETSDNPISVSVVRRYIEEYLL